MNVVRAKPYNLVIYRDKDLKVTCVPGSIDIQVIWHWRNAFVVPIEPKREAAGWVQDVRTLKQILDENMP